MRDNIPINQTQFPHFKVASHPIMTKNVDTCRRKLGQKTRLRARRGGGRIRNSPAPRPQLIQWVTVWQGHLAHGGLGAEAGGTEGLAERLRESRDADGCTEATSMPRPGSCFSSLRKRCFPCTGEVTGHSSLSQTGHATVSGRRLLWSPPELAQIPPVLCPLLVSYTTLLRGRLLETSCTTWGLYLTRLYCIQWSPLS